MPVGVAFGHFILRNGRKLNCSEVDAVRRVEHSDRGGGLVVAGDRHPIRNDSPQEVVGYAARPAVAGHLRLPFGVLTAGNRLAGIDV